QPGDEALKDSPRRKIRGSRGMGPDRAPPAAAAPDREREGNAMSSPETAEYIPSKWGLLAKYDDPILRFLMDRKFPWLKRVSSAPPPAPPATMPRSGARITTIRDGGLTPEATAQVQQYEVELASLSPEERRALFERESDKAAQERVLQQE